MSWVAPLALLAGRRRFGRRPGCPESHAAGPPRHKGHAIAGRSAHADARDGVGPSCPDLDPHRRHHRQDRKDPQRIAVRSGGGARQGRAARARLFPSSKSSMYQAYVTRVNARGGDAAIEVTLAATGRANTTLYVMEIVVEQGTVPLGAERGDHRGRRQAHRLRPAGPGNTCPAEIHTGIQGELLTQVIDGVKQEGDQVVTFGSFFIDAEHKLKGTARTVTMITAVIRAVIRWRAVAWLLVAAGVLFSVYSIRHGVARRHPRHLRSADRRLREVGAKPAAARNGGHRAAHQRAGRLARHPVDARVIRTWGTRSSTSS